MQRTAIFATPDFALDLTRGCQRVVAGNRDKRVQCAIVFVDATQTRLREFDGRDLAFPKKFGRVFERQKRKIPLLLLPDERLDAEERNGSGGPQTDSEKLSACGVHIQNVYFSAS